ncbi:MAG TPA: adenylate/guanylate cyclase domain-containing protein, partial [Acidimicrobiia bacterium]
CGTPLAAVCRNCGASLPSGARFCGECGASVAEQAIDEPRGGRLASPTPERRLVSVLFADLVGFTAASEQRDPEEVRDFLSRFFELSSVTISRYGGTVDHFIGDAVMGVWGSPQTHEDDAERAVRAAFDLAGDVATLAREFGIPELSYRAGIATGEAAVTLDAQTHMLVAGDLVNTASRLEASAPPGTILVNEATQRASSDAVTFEAAGELRLKGKSEAVAVWRPLQVVAMRGGAGRSSGLEAPFVGRTAELQLLKDLLGGVSTDHRAHLLSIQGMPGIGKTRLVWEFQKYLDGLVDVIFWHEGRSPAYGEGVTFWPLGEMVRQRAGIAESDDRVFTSLLLEAAIDQFIPETDRRWISMALQVLLGVADSPGAERDELFAAWRAFFEHISAQAPVVMVFEDLQWADQGTFDFIESLLEWSRNHPILVVTLARPELEDRRPHWGAGQRKFTGIHLEPLSEEEMRILLQGLAPGLPAGLTDQILRRAEGVPLYAVETVRMLVGQGHLVRTEKGFQLAGEIPELAVPETLHALVAARLDTLDPDDRQLLQRASVLGQAFAAKALASIAGLSPGEVELRLEPLVRREILAIEADPRSPERGLFRFVQSVIREVAYASLGRVDRSALHLEAARYLETLGDGELAGVIASHYVDAYEAVKSREEGPELARQTLGALESAAERAGGLGSHAQAVGYLEQAMRVSDDPAMLASLSERAALSAVLAGRSDLAETHFREALDHARSRGDVLTELRSSEGLGGVLLMESRVDEAVELLEQAAAVEAPEATREVVTLHAQLARAYAFREDGARAVSQIEMALTEAAELGLIDVIADGLVTKGWALALIGREVEALVVTEGAMSFANRHGLSRTDMRARNNVAAFAGWSDPAWTLEIVLPGLEAATRTGDMDDRANLGAKAAWAAFHTGEWDLAQQVIDDLSEGTLSWFGRGQVQSTLAILTAFRGDPQTGTALLDDLEPGVQASTAPQDWVGFLDARAWVALAANDPASARAYALDALQLEVGQWKDSATVTATHAAVWLRDPDLLAATIEEGERLGLRSQRFESCLQSGRAALLGLRGDREDAAGLFVAATDRLRKLGLKLELGLSQLERVSILGLDHEGGEAAHEEAQEIFTALGATSLLERLDEAA